MTKKCLLIVICIVCALVLDLENAILYMQTQFVQQERMNIQQHMLFQREDGLQ